MRIRFTVRWLLLAFALVAAFCWWWDRPRRTAHSLAAAIEAGDIDAFNGLIERMKLTGSPEMRVVARNQSAADWLRGISRLTVAVDIGEVMIIELKIGRDKAVRVPRSPDAAPAP